MNKTYLTQNLYEAAYLMAKGFDLAGKDATGAKTSIVFRYDPKIKEEAICFYNGSRVEAKKYSDCYRTLKDYIFTK